jgi:hypothetical protein
MGRFYANLTLHTTNHAAVEEIARSAGRPTLISPARNGSIVVFDGGEESDDPEFVHAQAELYSGSLDCAALGVINHDDSVLMYALYDRGELCDEYISSPDFFELDEDTAAMVEQGGDAAMLARAFAQSSAVVELESILRASPDDEDGYVFETDRHAALVAALSLNPAAVGTGYAELQEGERPAGFSETDFSAVP